MPSKVLHLIYSFYHGGAEHLIGTLIPASAGGRFEHAVCVMSSGGQPMDELRAAGVRIDAMGKKRGADAAFLPRLISFIRKAGPDIINTHNNSASLWGTAAVTAGRLDIPIVRTEHRPWLPGELPFLHRTSYPFLARRAARIITVSDHARLSFLASFPALEGRFVTIHNGISTERFESLPDRESCRRWFGFPEKAFIVGTIGRLVAIKNHRLLLDAFIEIRKRVPDAHLAILGDGPLEMDLKRHAAENGAGRNVSMIPGSPEVPRFLRALDVFTLTSDSEGLPLTLLEACASSLPVAATSVGGIPEVIEHGVSGLLVGRGDRDALVDEISALALDPLAGASLGAAARKSVAARFTADICASRTSSVYGQVLGED